MCKSDCQVSCDESIGIFLLACFYIDGCGFGVGGVCQKYLA